MTDIGGRVAFVIDSLGHGGAERMLVTIASEMAARQRPVSVCVLTERVDDGWRSALERHDVEVTTHGFTRLIDPKRWRDLETTLRRRHPTVVHTQLEASDIVGTAIASRMKVPSVSTQHVFTAPPGWRSTVRTKLQHLVLKRRSACVIAVSAAGRDHLTKNHTYPPQKVRVVHNGISLPIEESHDADHAQHRRELGLDPDAAVVMCCAVLRPAKGIEHLIDAVDDLRPDFPNVQLLVVGDGPHRQALEAHASRTRDARFVRFLGHRADVSSLLAAADIFAHPSLEDVFPTAIIEAMAAGLPVVASDTGGIPELVDSGATGMLVPPGEASAITAALRSYLTDPDLARVNGAAGRAAVQSNLTIDRQIDRLDAIYEEVQR